MSILLAFRVYVNVLAFVDKTQLFFPLLITSLRAIKVNPVLKFNQDLLSVQNQLFKTSLDQHISSFFNVYNGGGVRSRQEL